MSRQIGQPRSLICQICLCTQQVLTRRIADLGYDLQDGNSSILVELAYRLARLRRIPVFEGQGFQVPEREKKALANDFGLAP